MSLIESWQQVWKIRKTNKNFTKAVNYSAGKDMTYEEKYSYRRLLYIVFGPTDRQSQKKTEA